MVSPYLYVDLSLSEHIEHLSAAIHLALVLYKLAGKDSIPTNSLQNTWRAILIYKTWVLTNRPEKSNET